MVYKTKAMILSAIVAGLAIVYVGSLIFDPDLVNTRDAAYAWLDAKNIPYVDGIELRNVNGTVTLVRKNAAWFVSADGQDYPAKSQRVEDFLSLLSKKDAYPVRSTEVTSHERLGLLEDNAAHVTVRGGASPFLELLVGNTDASGGEAYLRKAGRNEVRSGTLSISNYISSAKTAWYNLRLFPETEKLTVDDVQRVMVTLPVDDSDGTLPSVPSAPIMLTFARTNGGWTVNGHEADAPKIESYVRSILDSEGDDFVTGVTADEIASSLSDGRIVLEFGSGTSRVISMSAIGDTNHRNASVSGSPYVYSLAGWMIDRLFRPEDEFLK
jgi:hypothetical protein